MLLCPLTNTDQWERRSRLYGLGHLNRDQLAMPLWKEAERLCAPSDAVTFLVVSSCLVGDAAAWPRWVALHDSPSPSDCCRTWTRRHRGVTFVSQFLQRASAHCIPMSAHETILRAPYHNDRFALGYARDNSIPFPCFFYIRSEDPRKPYRSFG